MTEEKTKPRCRWCNPANPLYVRYHDEEWGVPCHDDHALYELLILESFQAGLSWETVLNKRARFREVYDGFDLDKVCAYGEEKISQMLADEGIIRNRLKIRASIQNSRCFRDIQEEYGSFDKYIWGWTGGKTIYENDPAVTTSPLSDAISKDLKKRGMSFVGSTIIYAYLQAVGVINAHSDDCWLHGSRENTSHYRGDGNAGKGKAASGHGSAAEKAKSGRHHRVADHRHRLGLPNDLPQYLEA